MKRGSKARKGDLYLRLLVGVLLVCGLLVLMYLVGRKVETKHEETRGNLEDRFEDERTIEYEGVRYRAKKDLTTLLLMGVDKQEGEETQLYRNGGQADFLLLMVFDDAKDTVTQIQIDRDTMAEIKILGVLGNDAGTRTAQICLSHGFGDGDKQSCVLTAEAVSTLLMDTEIDYYMAMNLDGISVLNDQVGGVPVTLEDDFTSVDPEMKAGTTMVLRGEQAEYYVRSRMNIGAGTNESRMVRQNEYIEKVSNILGEKIKQSSAFVGDLLDALDPYITKDITSGRMMNLAWASRNYEKSEIIHPAGTYEIGADGFMEFHADEGALNQMVLSLFYEPVE